MVPAEVQQPTVVDGGSTSVSIRSEYAVFGNEYLKRNDPVIRGIRFAFHDFHAMLGLASVGYHAFGSIVDPDPRILEAIDRHKPTHAPAVSEHDSPWLFYFTGEHDILPPAQTVLGAITVLRDLHVTMSSGTNASDIPYVNIDFDDDPVTIDGAVAKMNTVRQFFAWIVGYAPTWNDVQVFKGKKIPQEYHRVNDNGNPDPGFDVFTSYFGGTTSQRTTPSGGHTLISPLGQSDHFMDVMTNWLARNRDRARANRTFFASTRGMFTTVLEDRICASANVFDQLPVSDRRNKRAKMLDVARRRYQKVIRPHVKLTDMEKVIESAVNCRHYITHGSTKGKTHGVDYSDWGAVEFLTEALRFVYGAYELLDCGWDMQHWLQRLFKRDHPFGRFTQLYEDRLSSVMPQDG